MIQQRQRLLFVRTCGPNGESHGNFQWPLAVGAEVACPDWNPKPVCGGGLHGLLNGEGDWSLLTLSDDGHVIVFSANADDVVKIDNKHKVSCARIEWVGGGRDWAGALQFVWQHTGTKPEAQASGYYGHAQASGDHGHAQASGYHGHAQASGYHGHAQASGHSGHAQASGYHGIAVALGMKAWCRASDSGGVIVLVDYSGVRPRVVAAYPGENGILANVWKTDGWCHASDAID